MQQQKQPVHQSQQETRPNEMKIPPPPPRHAQKQKENATTTRKGCQEDDGTASTANIDILSLPVITEKCMSNFTIGDIITYKIMELRSFQPVVSESRFGRVSA